MNIYSILNKNKIQEKNIYKINNKNYLVCSEIYLKKLSKKYIINFGNDDISYGNIQDEIGEYIKTIIIPSIVNPSLMEVFISNFSNKGEYIKKYLIINKQNTYLYDGIFTIYINLINVLYLLRIFLDIFSCKMISVGYGFIFSTLIQKLGIYTPGLADNFCAKRDLFHSEALLKSGNELRIQKDELNLFVNNFIKTFDENIKLIGKINVQSIQGVNEYIFTPNPEYEKTNIDKFFRDLLGGNLDIFINNIYNFSPSLLNDIGKKECKGNWIEIGVKDDVNILKITNFDTFIFNC